MAVTITTVNLDIEGERRRREREIDEIVAMLDQMWEDNHELKPPKLPYCIGVVGSRTFKDKELFEDVMQRTVLLHIEYPINIVSGGAKGADTMARFFAEENGFQLTEYLPDWERYGRKAGYIRNVQIVESSHEVVAFWDGKSRGTAMDIYLCKNYHVPVTIIRFER